MVTTRFRPHQGLSNFLFDSFKMYPTASEGFRPHQGLSNFLYKQAVCSSSEQLQFPSPSGVI